ncbi:hypothetical protein [Embleya sp. NBC_00896]|uniref:hypothetical protein n=1 Tax=Embleya sp. NBC_00896 TaxID=2975961 RepID=UPI002F91222F|nr:hypothetical protein OG928_45075 [Embleya sp. NBC_00896]
MSTVNKFGAACVNRRCSIYVAPRAGVLTRADGGQWVTWCTACAPDAGRGAACVRADADPEGPAGATPA